MIHSGAMPKPNPEAANLADYVRRIMLDKGLNAQDVERRSNKRITRGYVSKILSGAQKNLSVEKLEALADGLGQPLIEILWVASGGRPGDDPDFKASLFYALYLLREDAPADRQKLIDEVVLMLKEDEERRRHS